MSRLRLALPACLAAALLCLPARAQVPEGAVPHLDGGFGGEWFFLRSSDDNFILLPSGRFQMDFIGGQAGVPAATFLPKRARLEGFGTLLKHFDFQLGSEFTFGTAPSSTDELVNINYTPYANLQIGQYDAPFSMDNRTSDKYSDLMERTNAVRAFAFPENKQTGAMIWGQPEAKFAYWSLGLFNGDGINAYPNKDDRFDLIGRAWLAPFGAAGGSPLLEHVWLGGSYWSGYHTPTAAAQPDRTAMKDQAGFTFFGPKGVGLYGQVTKYGLELNAPIGQLVVKAEYLHGDEGLREESAAGAVKRRSRFFGSSWYVRASWFVFGDPLINGLGGMQNPPHLFGVLKPGKTEPALQLIAQYDHVGATYAANDDATPAADPLQGEYQLDSAALGVNYWQTRHVRLSFNAIYNVFGGASARPLAPDASGAPGNSNFELTARVALAL